MSRRTRIIVPVTLIAAGLWLLSGCFAFPGRDKPQGRESPAASVGKAKSDKPLRVGHATRADVERVLGPPPYVAVDGSGVAYTWNVTSGAWVMPLCFQAHPREGARTLVLRFDPASGALRSFQVLKQNESEMPMFGDVQIQPKVPADMRPVAEQSVPQVPGASR